MTDVPSSFWRDHGVKIIAAAIASIILNAGCALLPPGKRAVIELKNRTAIPSADDFDPAATLPALLSPGHDVHRWSSSNAARLEGYVVAVDEAGIEAANGFSFRRRDTHIEVALTREAPPRQRIVLEVTPPIRAWAQKQGLDWSTDALARDLVGRRCRFEGWLLFDAGHADEAENTNPGDRDNWRATAWEVHPVTSIVVLN